MPVPMTNQQFAAASGQWSAKPKCQPPIKKDMPSPSKEEMDSDLFNAIWDMIKHWDINVPDYYTGYAHGNGSHVKLLLDKIKPVIRNDKINEVLNENDRGEI